MSQSVDPVALSVELIRCASVTPEEGGALRLLQERLEAAGFFCQRVDRGGVSNLFARWGDKRAPMSFGFNGHTDVVPVGNIADWSQNPFGGEIIGDWLYGRGSVDMKSGVAAFVCAAIDFVKKGPLTKDQAIIITITGDEEGPALHGTRALLDWMKDEGEKMSCCLVGEPTCPKEMGEMIKIGRRGSMICQFSATGIQGHSAYPQHAKNPISALLQLLSHLEATNLDGGNDHFDPSTLVITTIDCGNKATNVIPARAFATVNIRFNNEHSGGSLSTWLRDEAAIIFEQTGVKIECDIQISGESFLTPPGILSDLVAGAVEAETGRSPVLSTSGGTSDARFIKEHCSVVEFGLVGKTMHQVDERVRVADIYKLKAIYQRILTDYFE